MTSTPIANGNGGMAHQVASTSAFAFDNSSPVGCCWCQDSGSRRYCRVTRWRYVACSRNCIRPAPIRRNTMPVALTTATATIAAEPPRRAPVVTCPDLNAGSTTRSVTRPSTTALITVITPYSALPASATANTQGSSRTASASTRRPRRRTPGGVRGASDTGPPRHGLRLRVPRRRRPVIPISARVPARANRPPAVVAGGGRSIGQRDHP